jgi:hypothetical protein
MKTPEQILQFIESEITLCKDVLNMFVSKEQNSYNYERKVSWISRLNALEELKLYIDGTTCI